MHLPTHPQHSTLPAPTNHPHTLARNLEIETLPSQTPRIGNADFPARRFDRSLPVAGFAESFGHADRRWEIADCAARSYEAECWESGARCVDCYGVRGEDERGGEGCGDEFEEGWWVGLGGVYCWRC